MADNIIQIGIEVDDGTVAVPIKNKFGKQLGVFYFRPTDLGIVDRYKVVSERFQEVVEPLQNVNIKADGSSDDEGMEALGKAKDKLFELCDFLFGGNMSEAFFGQMQPFSPINGKFYCELALNMVSEYISKQFEAETSKVNARVGKYTHGYKTGAHKDGRK